MTENDRLNRLESAMADMAEKFSEFMAIESARQERDKHQIEINETLKKFVEDYDKNQRATVETSKKIHAACWFFFTRVAAPGLILAILGSIYALK